MSHLENVKREANVALPRAGETYVADDGTVSQVLDDAIDESYEPTQDEIEEYAKWMGMSLPEDKEFLWLALEGLKTPLPKEWKPCRTNEGETYYFNFKTGESSWDHPMDSVIRKRFQREKERLQKAKATGVPGKVAVATAAVTGSANSSRVMMTESGIQQRTSAGSNSLNSTNNSATNTTTHSPNNSISNHLGGDGGIGGKGPAAAASVPVVSGVVAPSASASPATAAPQFVSESERILEDRIRKELKTSFDDEKAKAEQTHRAKLASMQKVHDQEKAEMAAEEEKRRSAADSEKDEERRTKLREAQQQCEEKYGTRLRELEREANDVETQLTKLTAELAREAQRGGGGDREAIERQGAADLAKALRDVDVEMSTYRTNKQKEMESSFVAKKNAARSKQQDAEQKLRLDLGQAFHSQEVASVMATEKKRKALEAERARLENEIATKQSLPATTTTAAAVSSTAASSSVDDKIRDINAKAEATCAAIRAGAEREQKTLQSDTETTLAALQKTLKEMPSSSSPASPLGCSNNNNSNSNSNNSNSTSQFYQQKLQMLKHETERRKSATLATLSRERSAKLSKVSKAAPSGSPLTPSTTGSTAPSTASSFLVSVAVQNLKSENAAAFKAKADYYQELEKQWSEKLAQEFEAATSNTLDKKVKEAIDTDMDLYIKQINTKRERTRAEIAQKKEKMINDHRIAKEAYEKQLAENEALKKRDMEEMTANALDDAIAADLSAERERLTKEMDAVIARRRVSYAQEGDAIRKEVDEEMLAYESRERQRIAELHKNKNDNNSTSAVVAAPVPAAATTVDAALVSEIARLERQLQESASGHEVDAQRLENLLREKQDALQRVHQDIQQLKQQQQQQQSQQRSLLPQPAKTQKQKRTKIVTKMTQPPNSVLRSEHAARMATLEEGYRSQEQSLQQQLSTSIAASQQQQQQRSAPPAVASQQTPIAPTQVCTPLSHSFPTVVPSSLQSPAQIPAAAGGVLMEESPVLPAGGFRSTDAMRLLHLQQESLAQRHQALHFAKEEWVRNEQQQRLEGTQPLPSVVPTESVSASWPMPRHQQQHHHRGGSSAVELTAVVDTLNERLDFLAQRVGRMEDSGRQRRSHSYSSPAVSRSNTQRKSGHQAEQSAQPHRSYSAHSAKKKHKKQHNEDDSLLYMKWGRILRDYRADLRQVCL